jgi:DNA-binding response OmpR family regulator
MTRVLLIDDDRALAQALAVHCIELGVAVRLAETLCEGVRYMVDGPVSAVLIDAALMRLSGSDRMRLFDTVAPGVPVLVLVRAGAVDEAARYQAQGFRVLTRPFDIADVLAKLDLPSRLPAPRAGAPAQIEALCR